MGIHPSGRLNPAVTLSLHLLFEEGLIRLPIPYNFSSQSNTERKSRRERKQQSHHIHRQEQRKNDATLLLACCVGAAGFLHS